MEHSQKSDIHIAGSDADAIARIDDALSRPVYIDPEPKRDEQMAEMLADPEAYFAKVRADAEAKAEQYIAAKKAKREEEDRIEHARLTLLGRLGLWWAAAKHGK